MAEYVSVNFNRKDCAQLKDGDVLRFCNVAQEAPHTRLKCFGRKVHFIHCNVARVEEWPEATFEDCPQLGNHLPIPGKTIDPEEEMSYEIKRLQKEYGEATVEKVVKADLKLEAKTVVDIPDMEKVK